MSITGDFHVYKNRTITRAITVKNSSGVAINLTGLHVYFTVKRTLDDDVTDTNAVIVKDISVHDDPTNGITSVTITGADTQNLDVGKYFFDVQYGSLKTPSGNGNFYIDRPTKLA